MVVAHPFPCFFSCLCSRYGTFSLPFAIPLSCPLLFPSLDSFLVIFPQPVLAAVSPFLFSSFHAFLFLIFSIFSPCFVQMVSNRTTCIFSSESRFYPGFPFQKFLLSNNFFYLWGGKFHDHSLSCIRKINFFLCYILSMRIPK